LSTGQINSAATKKAVGGVGAEIFQSFQEGISMSGPIIRTGATPEFSSGWDRIFGGQPAKKSAKKSSTKKADAKKVTGKTKATPAKKATAPKSTAAAPAKATAKKAAKKKTAKK